MWHLARAIHKHRLALCQWLQHNSSPWEESNSHVILTMRIRHHIPCALYRRPACNAIRRLGDGRHLMLRQTVWGSVRAAWTVRNTRMFLRKLELLLMHYGSLLIRTYGGSPSVTVDRRKLNPFSPLLEGFMRLSCYSTSEILQMLS